MSSRRDRHTRWTVEYDCLGQRIGMTSERKNTVTTAVLNLVLFRIFKPYSIHSKILAHGEPWTSNDV
ncbi:hypothetical protein DMJ13_27020 [halophilic archaeon]|nr:hypothetical protein DMJ13_27020 [halophilic archaeon]